jgi:hypothetical protein
MKVLSTSIARAIELVCSEGNSVALVSDGFSKLRQVVFMDQPLLPEVMSAIANELSLLRHYRSERTPNNPPDEGFVDDECAVAISFPIAGEAARWA